LPEGKTKNVPAGAIHSDEVLCFFAATLQLKTPVRAEQRRRPVHHECRVFFGRPLPAAAPRENPSRAQLAADSRAHRSSRLGQGAKLNKNLLLCCLNVV
jgi:hypothetical protein